MSSLPQNHVMFCLNTIEYNVKPTKKLKLFSQQAF